MYFIEQSINGYDTNCVMCLLTANDDINECINYCISNNVFIIGGKGDAVKWEFNEYKMNNIELPYTIKPKAFFGDSIVEQELCDNDGKCYTYVHGKWYRNLINSDNDEWKFNVNDGKMCFTWIVSDPSNGAIVRSTHSSKVYKYGYICSDINGVFMHIMV